MTTPEEDLVEESRRDRPEPEERGIEAPIEDAVEQATPTDPGVLRDDVHRGLEVGEYDAVEQSRVVEFDDDYR